MRNRTKLIIGLTLACAGTLVLGACSSNESPYADQAERGYNVQVRFDRNGGIFGGNANTDLVHVYPIADVENGVALTEPGSSALKGNANTASTVTKSGCFLVGWYRERKPLTDEGGNALDEFGELCSVSGNPQGYSYSGYWDFDKKQKLTKDDLTVVTEGKKTTYTFTLYAAWASFRYSFYGENAQGEWEEIGTYTIIPPTESIATPDWNETTGMMDYGFFPTREGYTIENTYLDPDTLIEAGDEIEHPGERDLETGLAVHSETKRRANVIDLALYTTWREGTWYHITKASQMTSSVDASGCYEIAADLDFTGLTWGFPNATFTGKIVGAKEDQTIAKLSNIKVTQSNAGQLRGGIFATIGAEAVMQNVFFENVTYTLGTATRLTGGEFGLFAGALSADCTMTDVRVSGTLEIGNVIKDFNFENYTVGLLSGNLVLKGISIADIKLKFIEVTVDRDAQGNTIMGYPLKGTSDPATGEVTLQKNEDTSVNPNES